jgi:3-deoxy-7-phosphoheptulonate synthase
VLVTRTLPANPPLMPPLALLERLPLGSAAASLVEYTRREIVDILDGRDDRLIVLVGPCSIHDPTAAIEFAHRLAALNKRLQPDLCIVMRAYCEKPRTTLGWKGLIHDPLLDGSSVVETGLFVARDLLLKILDLGVTVACEFLDPLAAMFIADTVSWGCIGARTSESPVHRQLASHLPMPVGFKNSTSGELQPAIDAIVASSSAHRFISLNRLGRAAVVNSTGNPNGHLVLRGGRTPNYQARSVRAACEALRSSGLPARVIVDASHGNSGKDHRRQPAVARDVVDQLAAGGEAIKGVMLESFLEDGRQELTLSGNMAFGQSVTDACIDWNSTQLLLHEMAGGVRARRQHRSAGLDSR